MINLGVDKENLRTYIKILLPVLFGAFVTLLVFGFVNNQPWLIIIAIIFLALFIILSIAFIIKKQGTKDICLI